MLAELMCKMLSHSLNSFVAAYYARHILSEVFYFTAPEIPVFERRNWLLHLHYTMKEYDKCRVNDIRKYKSFYCRIHIKNYNHLIIAYWMLPRKYFTGLNMMQEVVRVLQSLS